jgi:hypothetical protein
MLLEQIDRDGQQDDILHQERHIAGHRGKSGHGDPSFRHEGNDGDGGDEGRRRAGGTEDAEPLVPEAGEQQRTERPFGSAEELARALVAEHGIEPPDQRAVADEGHEAVGLIGPPLLVTEEENMITIAARTK